MEQKARKTEEKKKKRNNVCPTIMMLTTWCNWEKRNRPRKKNFKKRPKKKFYSFFIVQDFSIIKWYVSVSVSVITLNWKIKQKKIYKTQEKNTRTHKTMWNVNGLKIRGFSVQCSKFQANTLHYWFNSIFIMKSSISPLNIMTCYPIRLSLNLTI